MKYVYILLKLRKFDPGRFKKFNMGNFPRLAVRRLNLCVVTDSRSTFRESNFNL